MFADPITITINSVAKALVRINQDTYGSEYLLRESTQEYRLKIRNTQYLPKGGVATYRHNIEFVNTVYATSSSAEIVRKTYVVFESARADTDAAVLNNILGFVAFLTSTNVTKALNFES